MPPAASTFSRAVAEAACTVIVSFFESSPTPSSFTSLRIDANQPLRLQRLGRHFLARVEAVEVAEVHGLGVRAERADRHRVRRRVTAELGRAHVQRHLAALEAGPHGVRAGARLLALDPATGVATLARAHAAADALAILARLRGLQVREVELTGHYYCSSTFTRWRTLRSMPESTGLSVCSAVLPILPRPSARKRAAVALRLADRATNLRQLHFRHLVATSSVSSRLRRRLDARVARQHVADRLAARPRNVLGPAQLAQSRLGRLQHVDRVRRAERLREHVADAGELEHRAHAAAGDDAGTGRGRTQQHAGSVEAPERLVRDRLAVLRDREEVLLRVVDGLRDRERDLAGLAVADADAIDFVADHDERGEREPPAALDDLGDAVDLDDALLQLSRFLDVNCH